MRLSLAALAAALLALSTARPYYPSHAMTPRDVARVLDFGVAAVDVSLTSPLQRRKASKQHPLTPKGGKAGLSGYPDIHSQPAFRALAPHIGWYSDYTPHAPDEHGVQGVGMLWGAHGSGCQTTTSERLATFQRMVEKGNVPEVMFGFYEPDCACPSSSAMSVVEGAKEWERLLAPLHGRRAKNGQKIVLGSPSMCKQYDEDWLGSFQQKIDTPWDVTAVHINKPTLAEARKVVEYYVQRYRRPVWVAEFACVHDNGGWAPCTDQDEIDRFVGEVARYFEGSEHVVAYGPSSGEGLGSVWPLVDGEGRLTGTGRTYLRAIQEL